MARVARETFGIERVVARIYDPRRAAIYERLGIPTIATVQWATERVLHRILPDRPTVRVDRPQRQGGAGRAARPGRVGRAPRSLELDVGRAARRSSASPGSASAPIPAPGLLAQDGDVVHVAVARRRVDAFEAAPRAGPAHGGSH